VGRLSQGFPYTHKGGLDFDSKLGFSGSSTEDDRPCSTFSVEDAEDNGEGDDIHKVQDWPVGGALLKEIVRDGTDKSKLSEFVEDDEPHTRQSQDLNKDLPGDPTQESMGPHILMEDMEELTLRNRTLTPYMIPQNRMGRPVMRLSAMKLNHMIIPNLTGHL
jgi:hypothetical protein